MVMRPNPSGQKRTASRNTSTEPLSESARSTVFVAYEDSSRLEHLDAQSDHAAK
jgi:hypothetical protein